MPYASKGTKRRAKKIVAQVKKRKSSLMPVLYFLILPVIIYLFSISNASFPILGAVTQSLKSSFQNAHKLIRPPLTTIGQFFSSFIESNHPDLMARNRLISVSVSQNPPVRPLPSTTVEQKDALLADNRTRSPELIPLEFHSSITSRENILADKYNRIPESFKVPAGLHKRVGFWLDIYSRYSSRYHVIHHVDYPWIVYKVIDTTKIFLNDDSANKWTKYHRAQALVKKEQAFVKSQLYKLSRMRNYNHLTPEQQRYYDILLEIPGKRKTVFLNALANIRTQLGQKDFFRGGLVSGSKYLAQMEEIFAQYDLPVELTRLPLVESSFNEQAISKVGASGIWQFMPLVGKAYLKVTDSIDERNSPIKATEAAAKLMLLNFKITKNWPMAITAYNHGASGIMRASKKVRSTELALIIDRYSSHRFGFASSNFFCSFLAALYAERYQEEIFGDLPKFPLHRSEVLKLSQSFQAKTLASIAGITMEELRLYNPDLKARSITQWSQLPRGYRIFLPPGRKARIDLYTIETQEAARLKALARKQASKKSRSRVSAENKIRKAPKL